MAKKKPSKKTTKKSVKKATKKVVNQDEINLDRKDKIGTIHDAKNEILFFFNEEDSTRKKQGKEYLKIRGAFSKKKSVLEKIKKVSRRATELDEWDEVKKSLTAFNRIVTKEKIRLENEVRSGKNVRKNMRIIQNKEKIEISLPKSIRASLAEKFSAFKMKEFYLKTYNYDYVNNKINFFEGSDKFFFVLDTKFKKHRIAYKDLKKDTLLSEKNLVLKFIEIYEKDVQDAYNKDKKSMSAHYFKKRQKIYNKLFDVIEHNKNIATIDDYKKKLGKKKKNGDYIRKDGEYPMMFTMRDEFMEIYIA